MPKTYVSVPTKDEWLSDLGLKGTGLLWFDRSSPVSALERITGLVEEYNKEVGWVRGNSKGMGNAISQNTRLMEIVYHLYSLSSWLARKLGTVGGGQTQQKRDALKDKLGGVLPAEQHEAVLGLRDVTSNMLSNALRPLVGALDVRLTELYGREVSQGILDSDAQLIQVGFVTYFVTEVRRDPYKLRFRNGLAHRKVINPNANVPAQLVVYDTVAAGEVVENGGSLFVMDVRGRIYAGAQGLGNNLKHSTFMGGAPTLCAGGMLVKNGRVVWVSGKSGHYKPMAQQMVNLLERLRVYQVDLSSVKVYRENYRRTWKNANPLPNYFEPCEATDLLAKRQWPTDEEPGSMYVSRT